MNKNRKIAIKQVCRDDSGSILISSLVFLMVISVLLTGFGLIIVNESRQQEMIKDNYLAKTMIQKSYYIMREKTPEELSDLNQHTIQFNQGKVLISQRTAGYFNFTAQLPNQYQYSQSNQLFTEEDLTSELEAVNEEESDQEFNQFNRKEESDDEAVVEEHSQDSTNENESSHHASELGENEDASDD